MKQNIELVVNAKNAIAAVNLNQSVKILRERVLTKTSEHLFSEEELKVDPLADLNYGKIKM